MKNIIILPSFERSIRKLANSNKKRVAESLEALNNYFVSGQAPIGLGLKKINHDKYEIRAGMRLRIILKAEGNIVYLVLAGSHDDVKRYLRSYR